jgi:peptidoglycan/xylan/chitin deacetylase (PgdA/CDA1 family)
MIMSWDEIHKLALDPLVTIGAHTVNHYALAKLSEADARAEMVTSAEIISSYIGERPKHFSFPYGDPGSAGPRDFEIAKEVGFLTAVTTRKGVIHKEHADHMTALPRISLNGNYQSLRYLDVFLGGTAFSLKNRMRHLDVA